MNRIRLFLFVLAGTLFSFSTASAQEGHPAKGSWIGEWEGNEELGEFVLIVMDWDGEKISGTINPGTDNLMIEEANLNPDGWTMSIVAGDYEIEGVVEDLALPSRSIVGTWNKGGSGGKFEIVRQ